MKYKVQEADYKLSPYTGITRKHWLDICQFLLDGIFSHVANMEAPILLPRHEIKISYPRDDGAVWRKKAEIFEGLARSFLIAAPYLHNRPEAKANGYCLKKYYKDQILQAVNPEAPNYLWKLKEILPYAQPNEKAFQHTCECASLAIGLSICKEVIWDSYTKGEKDKIAQYLSHFGHAYTGHHNWRLFNMLILGFLHREGYSIDEDMMRDHAQEIVSYYVGDGWYRDGHLFDYYCPWAFHVYAPLWNVWYGYEKEPKLAQKIEEYSNCFIKTYDTMFDKDAFITMWGRSGIYRSAASAPFASNYLLKQSAANAGLARRIISGSLLQFITKEECFYKDILCLGFYGPFEAIIQSYSCAASPLWIANSFLCLSLPETDPFWTQQENNGIWESLQNTLETCLNGPGIVITNDARNGAVEFRTAKILLQKEDLLVNEYIRLSFHSKFPWETFQKDGIESMQYSITYPLSTVSQIPNLVLYGGEKEGVLYRKQYFDFDSTFQNKASIDLADIPISYGLLRVDKVHIPDKPYTITLGSYGMPDDGDIIVTQQEKRGANAWILSSNRGQLAFVTYCGFDEMGIKQRRGVNPVSLNSTLIYGKSDHKQYCEYRDYVLISCVLYKAAGQPFTEEELFQVKEIIMQDNNCGGYGSIEISLQGEKKVCINYSALEGNLMI